MPDRFYVNMKDRMLGDTIAIECRSYAQQQEVFTMARSENREMVLIRASANARRGAIRVSYHDYERFHYSRLAWRLDPKSNRSDKERIADRQLWSRLRDGMLQKIRFVQSCNDPAMIFVNRDVEIWVEFLPNGAVSLAVLENRVAKSYESRTMGGYQVIARQDGLTSYVHVGEIADLLMKYNPNPSDWQGVDFSFRSVLLGVKPSSDVLSKTRLAKCSAQDALTEANESLYKARLSFNNAMRYYGSPVIASQQSVNYATNLFAAMIRHEQAKQALNAANKAWVNARWPELA